MNDIQVKQIYKQDIQQSHYELRDHIIESEGQADKACDLQLEYDLELYYDELDAWEENINEIHDLQQEEENQIVKEFREKGDYQSLYFVRILGDITSTNNCKLIYCSFEVLNRFLLGLSSTDKWSLDKKFYEIHGDVLSWRNGSNMHSEAVQNGTNIYEPDQLLYVTFDEYLSGKISYQIVKAKREAENLYRTFHEQLNSK